MSRIVDLCRGCTIFLGTVIEGCALLLQKSAPHLEVVVEGWLDVQLSERAQSTMRRRASVEDPANSRVHQRHGAHRARFMGDVEVVACAKVRCLLVHFLFLRCDFTEDIFCCHWPHSSTLLSGNHVHCHHHSMLERMTCVSGRNDQRRGRVRVDDDNPNTRLLRAAPRAILM